MTSKIAGSLGRRRILSGLAGRQAFGRASFSTSSTSSTSSSSSWVTTRRPDDGDDRIAIVEMHRKPANALSMEMCREISGAIRTLQDDETTTAVVLASTLPNRIFSAGLDVPTELHRPDSDRLPEFWNSFQQLFLDLYGCLDLTTVAAIEGPAPAAGCMLALSCDYRAVLDKPSAVIGLNESHLGIVAPPWMCRQYIDVLGHRDAELALLSGILFPPKAALAKGLVDELVVEDDDGGSGEEASPTLRAALSKAKEFAGIPEGARAATKKLTRGPLLTTLEKDRERDADFFCEFVAADPVQAALGRYLEALAEKAAASKKPTK